jgi:amino acid adenylation domain-containing protein
VAESSFPTTFGQQGFWFIDQFEEGTDAYNDGEAFRLTGKLDVTALVRAVNQLVERHEALRTRLMVVDGAPRQVVDKRWAGRMEVIQAPVMPDRDAAGQAFAESVLARPFDLASGLLFRAELLRFDDEDHLLVLGAHHIIVDGSSFAIVMRELGLLYLSVRTGTAAQLPSLPVRYTDFASWQRELMQSAESERQLSLWLDQISGAPHVLLSLCTRRPGIEPAGGRVEFRLPAGTTDALTDMSRKAGTTVPMTLLAVYEVLLSRVGNVADLLVGMPVSGRTLPEVEELVGYFANTLAIRADLRDDPRFRDLLLQVRRTALSAYANQDVPFDRIVEAVNPTRMSGVPPLVQVSFQYFDSSSHIELKLPSVQSAALQVLGRRVPFSLSLDIFRAGDALFGQLHFDQAVFDEAFVSEFASAFQSVIAQALSNEDSRVSEFRISQGLIRLCEAVTADDARSAAFSAPRPGVEQIVADIMAEVLGVEVLGRDDSFFALGGHSLASVKVIFRVRELLGTAVSVRTLFENPTVAGFAAVLTDKVPIQVPISRAPDDSPVPMSYAQRRLWFVHELDPASTAYNLCQAFRICGPLSATALATAVDRLVARHEVLRTRFGVRAGIMVQLIDERPTAGLQVVQASSGADRDRTAHEFVRETVTHPFDLGQGPLFRPRLLRFDEQDHLLVLAMHHIVLDGWSVTLLLEDLAGLYGNEEPAPLAWRYRDFAAWQHQVLSGESLDHQLKYWSDHVADAPTVLDFLRPKAGREKSGAIEGTVTFELSAEIVAELRALSRASGGTLFMTLLAAFEVLLSRFTGERDLLVGVPFSGRSIPEAENIVGLFVNMLPLRADLTADPTFAELVRSVREVVLGSLAHPDLPFDHLVEAVNPRRLPGVQPLIQVAFQMIEAQAGASFALGDTTATPLAETPGMVNADLPLAMDLYHHGGGMRGLLTFSETVFSAGEAECMVVCFRALIDQVVLDSDRRVSELPLMPASQAKAVVALGVGRTVPLAGWSLLEEFGRRVAMTPDALAVADASGTWTFAELGRAVNAVAGVVAESGKFVAVAGARSRLLVAALLGVMQTGAAVVPLEVSDPLDRIRKVVENAGVEVLLCDGPAGRILEPLGLRQIALDQAVTGPVRRAFGPVPARALAFVTFTSGSTGAPKGVCVEHQALVNLLHSHQRVHFGTSAVRKVALTASIAFDAAWDQLLWLIAGHELHVADDLTRRDSESLLRFVRDNRIDVLDVPPSQVSHLLDLGLLSGHHRPSVLIMGGESIRPDLWRRLTAGNQIEAWNYYGPSECAIDALTWRLSDSDTPLIGAPIDNTAVRILDSAGDPVPVGVAGEIFLAGLNVARGYLNMPGLTAGRFVPDPFASRPGARMYRTGDLGRFTQLGAVEFLGRTDQQVKIRGYRVELGEIESVLSEHPDIREVVVSSRETPTGEAELLAHIIPGAGARLYPAVLRSLVASRLPDYMVPRAFIMLDAWPRLPSGKIDVKALPADGGDEPDFVPPVSGVEQAVAGIMAGILGVPRVGRFDNFFHIGGHSLRAGRVVARVRKLFGIAVTIRTLFENPTVAQFAESISAAASLPLPPLRPVSRSGAYPMSLAQQRLWLIHLLDPASTAYGMAELLRLRGPLDPEALSAAVEALVSRQEILRSRFSVVNNVPTQVVDERWQSALVVHGTEQPAAQAVTEFTGRVMARVYDLAQGPLFHVDLLRLDEQDHVLALTMHHIICDGWSVPVMFDEISRGYQAQLAGASACREPLRVQYGDFALWQHEQLDSEAIERHLSYWVDHIAGAPTRLEWLSHRGTAAMGTTTVEFALVPEVTSALRELAKQAGGSLFMALLAAFEVLLCSVSGERDVLIGIPVAGRTVPEVEDLVGFFVNLLALRADLRDDPPLTELLARVRDVVLGGFAHQDLPFERLVKAVNPERAADMTPLVQITFQLFAESADGAYAFPGLEVTALEAATVEPRFDVSLDMFPDGDGLRGWFYCANSALSVEDAGRLAGSFVTVVTALVQAPHRRVSELASAARCDRAEFSTAAAAFPSSASRFTANLSEVS